MTKNNTEQKAYEIAKSRMPYKRAFKEILKLGYKRNEAKKILNKFRNL